jgi:hypothetical protein
MRYAPLPGGPPGRGGLANRLGRVGETSAFQSTPFARQVAASRPPLLRTRSLSRGSLLAPRSVWPRPLSVGTCPPVTTYKANTGKLNRFLKCAEPDGKLLRLSVGHDASQQQRRGQVPARRPQSAGRGATSRPSMQRATCGQRGGRAALMRLNIWIVLAILLALLAATRYLRYRETPAICANEPTASACER